MAQPIVNDIAALVAENNGLKLRIRDLEAEIIEQKAKISDISRNWSRLYKNHNCGKNELLIFTGWLLIGASTAFMAYITYFLPFGPEKFDCGQTNIRPELSGCQYWTHKR
jgi:hypothetical protein